MKLRNWIEEATGMQMNFSPVYVGSKGGRKLYSITWNGGTEKDYFIDFEKHEIEEY